MALAVIVIANDFSAVNVALPTMESDFHTNINTIQWVVNAYALTFGVMIVTGGRLADMFGRRNAFFLGSLIFASMSALGGAAQTETWLIASRTVMGIGGALMWPAILGMTFAILPEEKAGLAGGIIIGAAGIGNAMGPLIGGVLTDLASWRWLFFLNVPVTIFAVARHLLPGPRRGAGGQRPPDRLRRGHDALGRAGLAARRPRPGRRLGLDRPAGDRPAGRSAWRCSPPSSRSSAGPATHALVPRAVMRNESFTASCIAILFMSATFFASLLYLPQFMENQLGYSPLESGVGMLPFLGTFALVSFIAGPLYNRARGEGRWRSSAPSASPSRRSSSPRSTPQSGYGSLVVGMVVLGIGIGSFYPTATTAGVTSVDSSQSSLAGGILYMFQIAGGSIGLGLTTTVFSASIPPFVDGVSRRLPARRRALAGRAADRRPPDRRPALPALAAAGAGHRLSRRAARRRLAQFGVVAGAADELVVAGAAGEPVVAGAAVEPVVAGAAVEPVVAAAADQLVARRRRRAACRRRRRRPACRAPAPPRIVAGTATSAPSTTRSSPRPGVDFEAADRRSLRIRARPGLLPGASRGRRRLRAARST